MKKLLFNFLWNLKKGYDQCIKNKKFPEIRKLIYELNSAEVPNSNNYESISLKQFLVQRVQFERSFRFFLFYAIRKKKNIFFFPVPPTYKEILNKYNIRLDIIYNYISWFFFVFSYYLNFFRTLVNLLKEKIFYSSCIKNSLPKKKIIIIDNVKFNDFFQNEKKKYNIINWFNDNYPGSYLVFASNKNSKIEFLDNYAKIKNSYSLFLYNINFFKIFQISLILILKNFFYLISFRWGEILLSSEILISKIVRPNLETNISFFRIWSNDVYEPIWVKKLKLLNVQFQSFILFNNIINEMSVPYAEKYQNLECDYEGFFLLTWSNYLVWDSYSAKYLKERLSSQAKIKIIKPLTFSDSNHKIRSTDQKSVGIFIYESHKWSFGVTQFADYSMINKKLIHYFIKDILEVAKKYSVKIYLKRKRNLEKKFQVLKTENFFKNLDNLIDIVDPSISPFRLIDETNASISLPFTSTGFIGLSYKKPSIYYDPITWVSKNDPSASGVNIVTGKEELDKWFGKNFQS